MGKLADSIRQLRSSLTEIKDIEDSGLRGKQFEKFFIKALKLCGLDFRENIASGPGWDIQTIGDGWVKLISSQDVNIKVHGTKWMLSASELYKGVPWDKLPDNYDSEKIVKKVRSVFNKKGVPQIYFLKPMDMGIQQKIIDATREEDTQALKKLLVKKNFKFERLGKGYGVRVLDNGERVTSIAITKGGKVFMRSEKPRKIGGSMTIAFRAPTPKLSKTIRKLSTMNVEEKNMLRKRGYQIESTFVLKGKVSKEEAKILVGGYLAKTAKSLNTMGKRKISFHFKENYMSEIIFTLALNGKDSGEILYDWESGTFSLEFSTMSNSKSLKTKSFKKLLPALIEIVNKR